MEDQAVVKFRNGHESLEISEAEAKWPGSGILDELCCVWTSSGLRGRSFCVASGLPNLVRHMNTRLVGGEIARVAADQYEAVGLGRGPDQHVG